jgi:hypothetical protein
VFQRAQHRHIQLGDAAGQHEHAIALVDTQPSQNIGESAGQLGELSVRVIPRLAAFAEPSDSESPAAASDDVPIHGFIRDVEPTAGKSV